MRMLTRSEPKEKAAKLKADIPAIFLALRDRRTPLPAKILAAVTVAYTLSPIDLIPDFIPVLGCLDDVLLLPILVIAVRKLIPASVWIECRSRAADLWKSGRPKRWYYAIPIVFLWLLLIWLIVKAIWF